MTQVSWYLNVNYVCNERCTFCAAELADGSLRIDGRLATISVADVERWLGAERPAPEDPVMLAGGEPTLHRDLLQIAELLSSRGAAVRVFTNGLRLADPAYAAAAVAAGITRFEIPFYGADAVTHEAVTRRRGSFNGTLAAVEVLAALRREHDIRINVRLLVSRQSAPENPKIVQLVHDRGFVVDSVSLERLILSEDAKAAQAEISWADASPSINTAADLVQSFGYDLRYEAVPLCVYTGDNAAYVRKQLESSNRSNEPMRQRYLDPYVAAGMRAEESPPRRRALPDPCAMCAYRNPCGRVERWYLRRFGVEGLHTVSEPLSTPVSIGSP
jgi:MoaA/NifB/PqqE/SkfB family radical SAM enzyme